MSGPNVSTARLSCDYWFTLGLSGCFLLTTDLIFLSLLLFFVWVMSAGALIDSVWLYIL